MRSFITPYSPSAIYAFVSASRKAADLTEDLTNPMAHLPNSRLAVDYCMFENGRLSSCVR